MNKYNAACFTLLRQVLERKRTFLCYVKFSTAFTNVDRTKKNNGQKWNTKKHHLHSGIHL